MRRHIMLNVLCMTCMICRVLQTNFLFWSLLYICMSEIGNLNIVFLETYENKVFSDILQLSMLQNTYELNE